MPALTVILVRPLAVACLLGAAACDNNQTFGAPPHPPASQPLPRSTVPTSPSIEPPATEEQKIVAQYVRFWTQTLPTAFAAPGAQRRAILATTTTNPQLDLLLDNMAALDAEGERGYGANQPITHSVELRSDSSLVRGCLDSQSAGILDSSGQPRTAGPQRNAVRVNVKREPDGEWKVSVVTYPANEAC